MSRDDAAAAAGALEAAATVSETLGRPDQADKDLRLALTVLGATEGSQAARLRDRLAELKAGKGA